MEEIPNYFVMYELASEKFTYLGYTENIRPINDKSDLVHFLVKCCL